MMHFSTLIVCMLSFGEIPTNGLVAYYPFDTDYKSASPAVAGPSLAVIGSASGVCIDGSGIFNGCAAFGGAGTVLQTVNHEGNVFAIETEFTVSFWLNTKMAPASKEMTLLEQYHDDYKSQWTITLLPGGQDFEYGQLRIQNRGAGITQGEILRADEFFNKDQQKHIRSRRLIDGWNHVVVCRRPTRSNKAGHYDTVIVINGHMAGIRPEENSSFSNPHVYPLQIGARSATVDEGGSSTSIGVGTDGVGTSTRHDPKLVQKKVNPLNGKLDEFLFWKRGLTESEVSSLWDYYVSIPATFRWTKSWRFSNESGPGTQGWRATTLRWVHALPEADINALSSPNGNLRGIATILSPGVFAGPVEIGVDFRRSAKGNSPSDGALIARAVVDGNNKVTTAVFLRYDGKNFYWHTLHNGVYSEPQNKSRGLQLAPGGSLPIRVQVNGNIYRAMMGNEEVTFLTPDFKLDRGKMGLMLNSDTIEFGELSVKAARPPQ